MTGSNFRWHTLNQEAKLGPINRGVVYPKSSCKITLNNGSLNRCDFYETYCMNRVNNKNPQHYEGLSYKGYWCNSYQIQRTKIYFDVFNEH